MLDQSKPSPRTGAERQRDYRDRLKAAQVKPCKPPPRTDAERQRDYRNRQKAIKLALAKLKPPPRTGAERQRDYRNRKKAALGEKIKPPPRTDAERQRDYRNRKKAAKMMATGGILTASHVGQLGRSKVENELFDGNNRKGDESNVGQQPRMCANGGSHSIGDTTSNRLDVANAAQRAKPCNAATDDAIRTVDDRLSRSKSYRNAANPKTLSKPSVVTVGCNDRILKILQKARSEPNASSAIKVRARRMKADLKQLDSDMLPELKIPSIESITEFLTSIDQTDVVEKRELKHPTENVRRTPASYSIRKDLERRLKCENLAEERPVANTISSTAKANKQLTNGESRVKLIAKAESCTANATITVRRRDANGLENMIDSDAVIGRPQKGSIVETTSHSVSINEPATTVLRPAKGEADERPVCTTRIDDISSKLAQKDSELRQFYLKYHNQIAASNNSQTVSFDVEQQQRQQQQQQQQQQRICSSPKHESSVPSAVLLDPCEPKRMVGAESSKRASNAAQKYNSSVTIGANRIKLALVKLKPPPRTGAERQRDYRNRKKVAKMGANVEPPVERTVRKEDSDVVECRRSAHKFRVVEPPKCTKGDSFTINEAIAHRLHGGNASQRVDPVTATDAEVPSNTRANAGCNDRILKILQKSRREPSASNGANPTGVVNDDEPRMRIHSKQIDVDALPELKIPSIESITEFLTNIDQTDVADGFELNDDNGTKIIRRMASHCAIRKEREERRAECKNFTDESRMAAADSSATDSNTRSTDANYRSKSNTPKRTTVVKLRDATGPYDEERVVVVVGGGGGGSCPPTNEKCERVTDALPSGAPPTVPKVASSQPLRDCGEAAGGVRDTRPKSPTTASSVDETRRRRVALATDKATGKGGDGRANWAPDAAPPDVDRQSNRRRRRRRRVAESIVAPNSPAVCGKRKRNSCGRFDGGRYGGADAKQPKAKKRSYAAVGYRIPSKNNVGLNCVPSEMPGTLSHPLADEIVTTFFLNSLWKS